MLNVITICDCIDIQWLRIIITISFGHLVHVI